MPQSSPGLAATLTSALVLTTLSAAHAAPFRLGARIIRAEPGPTDVTPELRILDEPDAWTLVEADGFTMLNGREYDFTIESTAQREPPRVEVRWPGVAIARVLGADGEVEQMADGVRFKLAPRPAKPTVQTTLRDGQHVIMAIFHNLEARRAGYYREGDWPETQIRAQLNYLFAAREAARAMGLTASEDPGFDGDVRLYGFETNFAHGHVDHPPHFHLMLGWPGWTGTQATHFRLDAEGRILNNEFQFVDTPGRNRTYTRGERCDCVDRSGKVGFSLTIDEDGLGVIWSWPGSAKTYRLRGVQAAELVAVERRAAEGGWEPVCRVKVDDDAAAGELRIEVTPEGGEAAVELVRYDPDTGRVL